MTARLRSLKPQRVAAKEKVDTQEIAIFFGRPAMATIIAT